jgi:CubicO group peptidase (beta-lactamase class C family)
MRHATRRLSLALLLLSLMSILPAAARAERSTTTPTGWWWFQGATLDNVADKISQGYRLTDLEIEGVSPFRVSAVLVKNSGAHAKGWWWYYGVSPQFISDKISEHQARIIDMETYVEGGVRKYAVVMVANSGAAAKGWWWYYGLDSAAAISAKLDEKGARLIDIDTFVSGGQRYYNVVMLKNSGADAKGWWWYYNVTPEFIGQKLNENGARLTDIERHDNGTFTVIMEQSQGEYWWWYYGLQTVDQIKHLTTLNNARLIDIEPYFPSPGDKRYAVIMLQNGPPPQYDIPVRGAAVPSLKAFDDTMVDFMRDRDIPGGTLVVMKDSKVVLERGYGWKDERETVAMPPSALLRLASVTKPFTQAILRRLEAQGALNLDDRVFCLPGSPANCQLDIDPWPNAGLFDARLRTITIQHLMDHEGGWDRDVSGDPMFKAATIASAMGVASPPSKENIARWVLGKPLDFTPGTKDAYSNFGYMLLGLIIEQQSGQDYTAYLRDQIMNPLGVPDSEIGLGRTLSALANPREPFYHAAGTGASVYPPHAQVAKPYGAWHLEAMEAHGGLIASARAVAEFLDSYWISGVPRAGNGQSWAFFGSLDGTWTLARQRADGVNIVALFNQRSDPSGLKYDLIMEQLDRAADSIASWPGDVAPILLPQAALNFADGAPGSFFTMRASGLESNEEYRLELRAARPDGALLGTANLGSDADGGAAVRIDTRGLAPGVYYGLLLPAVQSAREAASVADAPLLDQRADEGEPLLTASFELSADGVLRPAEEGVEGPTLTPTPAAPAESSIFLPLLQR